MSSKELTWRVEGSRLLIQLPDSNVEEVTAALNAAMRTWLIQPCETIVLDFSNVRVLKPASYAPLVQFCLLVKKGRKTVVSTNLHPAVAVEVRAHGLWSTFNHLPEGSNLEPKKLSLDANLVAKLSEATVVALETQAKVSCEVKRPMLVDGKAYAQLEPLGIEAILAIVSTKFSGSIALGFTVPSFLHICRSMLGEELTEISAEVEDVAAELLNIIYGTAKRRLNDQFGYDFKPAFPSVIRGSELSRRALEGGKRFVMPMTTASGSLRLEIDFENHNLPRS